ADAGGPANRTLDTPDDGLGREDTARPPAVRARDGERLVQRGPDALSRHLDQAEFGDLERARPCTIAVQVRAQFLEDAVLIRLGLHVDEVADDDAADVPKAELSRDLPCGVEVGLEDRLLGVLLPRVAAGVDVDRDERLGRLDDDVAAAGEVYAALERLADRVFDAVAVEQRDRVGVEPDAAQEIGIDALEVLLHLVVDFLVVD